MEMLKERKETHDEEKRIKGEVKKIMDKNFEIEKKFYVDYNS